jgi:valyl-tRNA synthetase
LSGEFGAFDISWPDSKTLDMDFTDAVAKVDFLKEMIVSVRSIRKYLRIQAAEKLAARLETRNESFSKFILERPENSEILERMGGIKITEQVFRQTVPIVLNGAIVHMEFPGKIDIKAEIARLKGEKKKLCATREAAVSKLNNLDFVNKASAEVVEDYRERITTLNEKINNLNYTIESLDAS